MPGTLDEADRRYLQRAIDISRRALEDEGKTPFGALVVVADTIVGEGTSNAVDLDDAPAAAVAPLPHAVSGYAPGEPYPMGPTACYWARIPRLVYGATSYDVATYGFE